MGVTEVLKVRAACILSAWGQSSRTLNNGSEDKIGAGGQIEIYQKILEREIIDRVLGGLQYRWEKITD